MNKFTNLYCPTMGKNYIIFKYIYLEFIIVTENFRYVIEDCAAVVCPMVNA